MIVVNFWLRNLVKIIAVLLVITSCAAIPARKVKIENYPNFDKNQLRNTSLDVVISKDYSAKPPFNIGDSLTKIYSERDFNKKIFESFKSKGLDPFAEGKKPQNAGCLVRITTQKNDDQFDGFCGPYYFATFFTLFTIPYYCQHIYQANATLVSYPSPESIKGKAININPNQINFSSNKIQIKQGKKGNYILTEDKKKIYEGEYFIESYQVLNQNSESDANQTNKKMEQNLTNINSPDSSGSEKWRTLIHEPLMKKNKLEEQFKEQYRLAHLLKTYELKDKVHEVWSLLMILAGFVYKPLHELPSDDYGKRITENNISESLTRSILNDASNFEECRKDAALAKKR